MVETDTCPVCGRELGYIGVILDEETEVVVCELLVCRNEDCAEWAVVYARGERLVRVGAAVANGRSIDGGEGSVV